MVDEIPERQARGRGAASNRSGRFERHTRVRTDDGWTAPGLSDPDDCPGGDPDGELPPLRTSLSIDHSRSVITYNKSPDIPFDRSINPYRGCEHGCFYCFARPTHAYFGLSAGLDFETRLFYKPDAPEQLERELRAKSYRPATVAIGTATDPYQPVEREIGLTRRILSVLADFSHPLGIVTKSALVARDVDILAPMAARRLAHVCVSVTTLDRKLARAMEPRAATPARRLEAIRTLTGAGVPVTVLASPMIPGLNDHELEAILGAAAEAGATAAGTLMVRLPLELRDLFSEWLQAHVPDRAGRVLALIRDMRGGALYDSRFGSRFTGEGPLAQLLADRFAKACRRYGFGRRPPLDTGRFQPPPRPGDQLALL